MINLTFPDGNIKKFPKDITGSEIAKSISRSLLKDSFAIEVNNEIIDLSRKISSDAKIRIITSKDKEALDIARHDAAHVMAEALKKLYPDCQITIGPSTKEGFYYDFLPKENISENDFDKIEREMRKIALRNSPFERIEIDRDEAIKLFESKGEFYKAEIIRDIDESQKITLYKQGDFIDLCRGPHAPSSSKSVKYFKLIKIAGAYWRGDSNNQMLQRIYGTAFLSQQDLDDYLFMIKEAKERDHRKIGKDLDLFHLQEEAKGSVFWHHNGYMVYKLIQQYIRNKITKYGYSEVKTPTLVDRSLWEKSGHWDKFKENMFTISSEEEDKEHALKPMNCPCHVQIFKNKIRSYRDLPLRMSEFGSCYRNESSGALHGLLRVRNFVQDDGHIFCSEDQINNETVSFCNMLISIYKDFGFNEIKVKFSTRPEKRAGSEEVWDKAEKALEDALKKTSLEYEVNSGEGAFYGPKLEFTLTDSMKREWQCGTIQVDFIVPNRLGASYIDKDGRKRVPVMLHRAVIGTFERFIGILIEQYAGKFPIWISPVQVVVTSITSDYDDYARNIYKKLVSEKIRAEIDLDNEKISYKISNHSRKKIPVIIVVGKKEFEENTISIRKIGSHKTSIYSLEKLINDINIENKKYFD
ncbi:MAG TPA: threonine--tRNA ligase [Candidatus Megaira endosymbiont of Hartmannula sinica]|nr:threonine--tRNA ligase [Candidatus Megaera endosymbiont of Hartmannula sinica]